MESAARRHKNNKRHIPKGNRDYYWCGHNELCSLSGTTFGCGAKTKEELQTKLAQILDRLSKAGMTVNKEKCIMETRGHQILRLPHFRKWHKTRPRVDPEDIEHRSAEKQEAVGLIYGSGKLLRKIR